MKHKELYIAIIIFFLLVNTSYYWEGLVEMYANVTVSLLLFYFVILTAILFKHSFIAINEKLSNRPRLILIAVMTVVLGLSYFYPNGLINFNYFQDKPIFIAQREGAANCMTTFTLQADKTFIERTVCFGVETTTGTYSIKGDTIFFENVSTGRQKDVYFKFGVIKLAQDHNEYKLGDIVRFESYPDTTGNPLWIIKNELFAPYLY